MAGPTGLEPATSGVTGRHSNQLNYDPVRPSSAYRPLLSSSYSRRHAAFTDGFLSRVLRNLRGGRWGIRTRDPLRVKQVLYP